MISETNLLLYTDGDDPLPGLNPGFKKKRRGVDIRSLKPTPQVEVLRSSSINYKKKYSDVKWCILVYDKIYTVHAVLPINFSFVCACV